MGDFAVLNGLFWLTANLCQHLDGAAEALRWVGAPDPLPPGLWYLYLHSRAHCCAYAASTRRPLRSRPDRGRPPLRRRRTDPWPGNGALRGR